MAQVEYLDQVFYFPIQMGKQKTPKKKGQDLLILDPTGCQTFFTQRSHLLLP